MLPSPVEYSGFQIDIPEDAVKGCLLISCQRVLGIIFEGLNLLDYITDFGHGLQNPE
jgi:hypothetical protein